VSLGSLSGEWKLFQLWNAGAKSLEPLREDVYLESSPKKLVVGLRFKSWIKFRGTGQCSAQTFYLGWLWKRLGIA
jgi:hypothetical protein